MWRFVGDSLNQKKRSMQLSAETAATIRADLSQFPGPCLPSIAALCRRYDVSRSTMIDAVHLLRDEGVLRFHRGQAMRISGRTRPQVPARVPAARALARELRQEIERGEHAVGEPLPKVAYVSRARSCSNHTVRKAYEILTHEGLVSRQGKVWLVGTEKLRGLCHRSAPPVVLLVQPRERTWASLGTSERTAAFCRTFSTELARAGVELVPALTEPGPAGTPMVAGLDAIADLRTRLGTRLCGVLVAGSRDEIPGLDSLVRVLSDSGTRLVWFDRYDEKPLSMSRSRCVRCHFSEVNALATALDALDTQGHRVVGYAYPYVHRQWEYHRGQRLARHASDRGVQVVVSPPIEHLAAEMDAPWFVDALRRLYAMAGPLTRTFDHVLERLPALQPMMEPRVRVPADGDPARRLAAVMRFLATGGTTHAVDILGRDHTSLAYLTPMFLHLLRAADLSAVIAPADTYATTYYRWLSSAVLPDGRSLFLMSFDNSWDTHPMPISSVDFGFGRLGYAAAHLLLGTVAVRLDGPGRLAASPYAVLRGRNV